MPLSKDIETLLNLPKSPKKEDPAQRIANLEAECSKLRVIVEQLAEYSEEVWEKENFRNGYKQVSSGLIVDAARAIQI